MRSYDDNYPRITKLYRGREIPGRRVLGVPVRTVVDTDVRMFIRPDDWALRVVYAQILRGDRSMPEEMFVAEVQRWVVRSIKYTGDASFWGANEFWQLPCETLTLRTGDCEDGAFLIHSLLRMHGIEASRVRTTAGWVKAGAGAAQGGHAYVTLQIADDTWVPIDWCYLPEIQNSYAARTPLKQRAEYLAPWFSFDDRYCWDQAAQPIIAGRVRSAP